MRLINAPIASVFHDDAGSCVAHQQHL